MSIKEKKGRDGEKKEGKEEERGEGGKKRERKKKQITRP